VFGIVDIVAIFSGLRLFFYLQLHPYILNFNLSDFIKEKFNDRGSKWKTLKTTWSI
jgi:hypothetical protein